MSKTYTLSKSKYLNGLQCHKLLWMSYHAKEKFPAFDIQTQANFDQGHQVTKLACSLFPNGIEIKGADDFEGIVQETQKLISLKKPLFEPGFRFKNTYARADILSPNEDGSWDIYEVKSSTEVKDVYYPDVAFQKYCYEGAGLRIRKTFLTYINNQYVKNGDINPKEFFIHEDITEIINGMMGSVEKNIREMIDILNQSTCPDVKIGLQCDDPYECPLKIICWDFLPEESVFILNRIRKKKAFELLDKQILAIKDVTSDVQLTESQRIQWQCHNERKVHIDSAAIKSFLRQLQLPLYFLDFETVNPGIPFYNLTRPYQKIPFQFSLHILKSWDEEPEHHAFLADGKEDPRPELLSLLKSLVVGKGSIVSYNMSFELSVLRESIEAYSEYRNWFKDIESRFLDLIVPFRNFNYYDPKQMGRTSIKNVFPALTGGSYEGMEIAGGDIASIEFARITFSEGIKEEEKRKIRKGLEDYCKLDTQAMISVLKVLKRVAG